MSVSVSYISEGNNVRGPEIGAEGGLGNPNLEVKKEYNDDWGVYSYTFGWILSGLESVGLVTEQVADFKEFLTNNQDRNIYLFVEGGEDPNEEKIDWDNIIPFSATEKPEYKVCNYKITNKDSGESAQFDNEDRIEKLVPCEKYLTQEEIDNFIEKLISADMIDDSFYNQWKLLEPYEDFGRIRDFISNNRTGQLVVSINEI
jgi:hypothetical protein